jgi:hypothetical protein
MNNPDEETAEAQFGKSDKYFGVCIMMVTMPGLPMFGHGQIEGYTEKYGMEYRRAYRDEQVDQDLVRRHEREVFPLMRLRYLFSDVSNFYLYDFFTPEGHVNQNVFAYSNSARGQHGLVVYHNKFEETSGWVKRSSAFSVKVNGDERRLEQRELGQALGLHHQDDYFVIFREHLSGLEFIRRSHQIHEQGLFISLKAFQSQVFLDFREVEDNVWHHYANLESYLNGRGVPSIEEALKELFLIPLHRAFRQLVSKEVFETAYEKQKRKKSQKLDSQWITEITGSMQTFAEEIRNFSGGKGKPESVSGEFNKYLKLLLELPVLHQTVKCTENRQAQITLKSFTVLCTSEKSSWYLLFSWAIVRGLGALVDEEEIAVQSRAGLDEWLLQKILVQNLYDLGIPHEKVEESSQILKILTSHQNWWQIAKESKQKAYLILERLLKDSEVSDYLRINRHREILWFNLERFQMLMKWLLTVGVIEAIVERSKDMCKEIASRKQIVQKIERAQKKSEFQVEKLLEGLK